MDYTNCTQYWATDHLFERTPIGSCNSSLIFLWTYHGLIVFLRILAVVKKWMNYFAIPIANRKYRIPIGPWLASCLAVGYLIFFILLLFDVINVDNGISFSVFTICYLFFAAIFIRSYLRMVKLGTKIATASKDVGNTAALEKMDRYGYILMSIATFFLFLTSTVLIFAGPIHPEDDLLFGQIGWASKGAFQVCITLGLMWQMQRCYDFLKDRLPDSSPKKKEVLHRLKRSQQHYSLFGMVVAVLFLLLASRVLLWYW